MTSKDVRSGGSATKNTEVGRAWGSENYTRDWPSFLSKRRRNSTTWSTLDPTNANASNAALYSTRLLIARFTVAYSHNHIMHNVRWWFWTLKTPTNTAHTPRKQHYVRKRVRLRYSILSQRDDTQCSTHAQAVYCWQKQMKDLWTHQLPVGQFGTEASAVQIALHRWLPQAFQFAPSQVQNVLHQDQHYDHTFMTSIMSNKKHIWSSHCSSWKKSDSSCTKANEDQTLGKKLHTILQVFLTGEVANMDIKVNCLMYWTKVGEAELVEASPLCHKLKLLLCFLFDVLYLVTWWPLNLWNQKHNTTHHILLWISTPSTKNIRPRAQSLKLLRVSVGVRWS